MIIGGSGSGKANILLNLIKKQDDIDKIYLYAKDLSEPKYQFLIENRENAGIKHLNDQKAFIECSNSMDDVYEDIDEYNPTRKRNILVVSDDVIAGIMSNKKNSSCCERVVYQTQKTKYVTCFYFTVLFFCSKRCQIKFNTLLDYEN